MYQEITLIGNLGRDVEARYTPQGKMVCDFSVAVTKRTGSGENATEYTTWFKVTCWEKLAENVANYLKKGSKVLIKGEVKASAYMDKSGKPQASLELTANKVLFLDSKQESEQRQQATANTNVRSRREQQAPVSEVEEMDFD